MTDHATNKPTTVINPSGYRFDRLRALALAQSAPAEPAPPTKLYLDFSNMKYDPTTEQFCFPVDYLREQLNVPENIKDSYLGGSYRNIEDTLCASPGRARAMIYRALDTGWIESVPDHIWRSCFIACRGKLIDASSAYVYYELVPGTGFGMALIKGNHHREKIIDLATHGFYVTQRINGCRETKPEFGKEIITDVVLISEAEASEM